MRTRCWILFALVLFLAAGCGEVPTGAVPPPPPAMPPTDTPVPYPPPSPPPTPTPAPRPTEEVAPTPIVLGAEWAPESEREVYVSTTVVVARVGDGPGEIGFYRPPYTETTAITARHFTVDVHGNIYILDVVNQRVVKFDPQGQFVTNIVYGDAVQGPADLAVDAEGRVYIYEAAAYGPTPQEAVPKVKLFAPEGKLLWEVPVPSWFMNGHILAMRVDEQGTLWVEGEGYSPNAPVIDGQPYPRVTAPLGNATEVFDEERQKAMAIPGHLLDSGGTAITHAPFSNAYLYDLQGRPIYELADQRGVVAVDEWGFWYLIGYDPVDARMYMRLHKLGNDGKEIAAFDLPLGPTLVDANGTAYCLVFDWQTKTDYRIIRWQQK